MISETKPIKQPNYINPYFGGVLLGLTLILVFYIAGRGLSASGAVKLTVVAITEFFSPEYVESNGYMDTFVPEDGSPILSNWLIFLAIGTVVGGLISGAIYGRLGKLRVEHSPKITAKTRLFAAGIGGILFGIGSQFGRGCASGAALSGTGSLSFGGLIVMLLMFGTAFAGAYFVRKLWI